MNLLKSIHELPNIEKIKVMEFLWDELTSTENEYTSPQWHKNVLEETEQRLAEGKEEVMDWHQAKQLLRNEFK